MASPTPYLRQPFRPINPRRLAFDEMIFPQDSRRDDMPSRNLFPSADNQPALSGKQSPWVKSVNVH